MPNLTANLAAVRDRIDKACASCGRDPASVQLLAVSKTQPAPAIRELASAGQRDFGENYLAEALAKSVALADLDIVWHYIGAIQSNKTRAIAEHFDWVHSVDRLKIARRLSDQRPPARGPLNLCLQVNLDAEASKAGAALDEVAELAAAVAALPNLRLRGLMAIPAPRETPSEQRAAFAKLAQALAQCRLREARLAELDTLSMGMSGDLEAAIAEGATWVRIGTALFGPRPPQSTTTAGDG